MMNKNKAIQVIKDICDQDANLNLCVIGSVASYSLNPTRMTPENWKHIGYVSALAAAFDIDKVD